MCRMWLCFILDGVKLAFIIKGLNIMYFVAVYKVNKYKMRNSFMYENIYTRSKPLCETELEIIITYVVAYNDSSCTSCHL